MAIEEITLPEVGGGDPVTVTEIYVKVGDSIALDDPLFGVESEKAVVDVPAPVAGIVKEIRVTSGSKINDGDSIARIETVEESAGTSEKAPVAPDPATDANVPQAIHLPEVGGGDPVTVTEIYVKVGDSVTLDDPLFGVESEKAVVDVPAPVTGVVRELKVNAGDKINDGDLIAMIVVAGQSAAQAPVDTAVKASPAAAPAASPQNVSVPVRQTTGIKVHGSPSVRAFARRLGVALSGVSATGSKGRILHSDVEAFVKKALESGGGGSALPALPKVDVTAFGPTETVTLSRIKQITGERLHASWVNIPHVNLVETVDITALESFRKSLNNARKSDDDPKYSPLVFIIKACALALKQYPSFNSSLSDDGKELIIRQYYNIGVAVDTPAGLLVPVIKDADKLSLREIALELLRVSTAARKGKLAGKDMRGGTFSISSLGGLGSTSFTPIINPPEVAIMGLSKSQMQPVWNGSEFQPKLIMPFSISFDHRVIDGAEAARMASMVKMLLEDMRRMLV